MKIWEFMQNKEKQNNTNVEICKWQIVDESICLVIILLLLYPQNFYEKILYAQVMIQCYPVNLVKRI